MFNTRRGDIFASKADALAHGVNTVGIMGSGIAVSFAKQYPGMYQYYKLMCEQQGGRLAGLILPWSNPYTSAPRVYNLFTQIYPGGNASYALLMSSALMMRLHAEEAELKTVALPEIGCGIGGLDYHNVHAILDTVLKDSWVTFTMYSFDPQKSSNEQKEISNEV